MVWRKRKALVNSGEMIVEGGEMCNVRGWEGSGGWMDD